MPILYMLGKEGISVLQTSIFVLILIMYVFYMTHDKKIRKLLFH